MAHFIRHLARALTIALTALLLVKVAHAANDTPLRPLDTSSPRATLQGFDAMMDDLYRDMKDVLREYAASSRLYLTTAERRKQFEALSTAPKVTKVLDLSDVPPILRDTVGPERALQLKEILDRIEFLSFERIPDQEMMARASSKRWRLPGTEIDISLIESGPRSGEWLISADTVARLPEFYDRVKRLPYKTGPGAELSDIYRRVSSSSTATIYDAFTSSPVGLERIVPIRWMLASRLGRGFP